MKTIVCSVLFAAVALSCSAQVGFKSHQWTANLQVLDERDQPVANAEVWVSFSVPSSEGNPLHSKIAGQTDAQGVFKATHTDPSINLGFHARKDGHYPAWVQHYIGFEPEDHPERLTPTVTLILKRIIKPVPMYAKFVNLGMPAFGKPVAFDLSAGDWVAPYGKGMNKDILFTGNLEKRSENASDYKLVVSFPNPGDGIQEFPVPRLPIGEGSGLRSPHQAPADGYQPEWVQTDTRKVGQSIHANRDSERNYFFRVRTLLDEKGNIKTALYGKIYGDFMKFRYYLNPIPNDRNVEFDPKVNLLKGLKATEQVREP